MAVLSALRTQDYGVSDVGQKRQRQKETEHSPSAVDLLHKEIFRLRQPDLVQELEGVRRRRYQRKPGYDDREEPHGRSTTRGLVRSAGSRLCAAYAGRTTTLVPTGVCE
jgi:hypothetical protein